MNRKFKGRALMKRAQRHVLEDAFANRVVILGNVNLSIIVYKLVGLSIQSYYGRAE